MKNFAISVGPSTSSGTDHRRGPSTGSGTGPLLALIDIHRVLVVVGAVEVDFDVDIVLGAVHLDGAVLGLNNLFEQGTNLPALS